MLCCCSERGAAAAEEEEKEAQAAAAVKIQSRHRGNKDRQLTKKRQDELNAYKNADNDAAAPAEDFAEEGGAVVNRIMQLEVISAKGLRDVVGAVLRGKRSCPFVRCEVSTIKFHTETIKSNLNPTFNESFEVVDYPAGTPIEFSVWHPAVKKTPEICLGRCRLESSNFEAEGYEGELKLTDTAKKPKDGEASLKVKIVWQDTALIVKQGRISAFKDLPVEQWTVRFRAIGLRCGPGVHETRANIDLRPGEEFGVVEIVEGFDEQKFLRLADGRGWAFVKSAKDGEILAEKIDNTVTIDPEDVEASAEEVAQAKAGDVKQETPAVAAK